MIKKADIKAYGVMLTEHWFAKIGERKPQTIYCGSEDYVEFFK